VTVADNVKLQVVPKTPAQKVTQTILDTIEITPDAVRAWESPPFQRPLKVNDKVRAIAAEIRANGGVVPGVLTLGRLEGRTYLLDGQHRREAYLLSEVAVGYVDVRIHRFESFADMGEEFVRLNTAIVTLKPDDVLRGLEGACAPMAKIRRLHPFVGFEMIRRNARAPILSMSALLRSWFGSAPETPKSSGLSAVDIAREITGDDADLLSEFLNLAYSAWGRDAEYARLWSTLNLIICMWLFRRLVVASWSPNVPKLTKEMFGKCLMALSADKHHIDWLHGRVFNSRDRSPCYTRIKAIFAKRIEEETGKRPRLPQPPWGANH